MENYEWSSSAKHSVKSQFSLYLLTVICAPLSVFTAYAPTCSLRFRPMFANLVGLGWFGHFMDVGVRFVLFVFFFQEDQWRTKGTKPRNFSLFSKRVFWWTPIHRGLHLRWIRVGLPTEIPNSFFWGGVRECVLALLAWTQLPSELWWTGLLKCVCQTKSMPILFGFLFPLLNDRNVSVEVGQQTWFLTFSHAHSTRCCQCVRERMSLPAVGQALQFVESGFLKRLFSPRLCI